MQLPEILSLTKKGLLVFSLFIALAIGVFALTEVIIPTNVYPVVVWDDVYISLTSVKLAGVNDPDFNIFRTPTRAFEFQNNPSAQQDEVFFTFQMPHTYKLNSSFEAHLHWSPDSNISGTAEMSLDCTKADISDLFPSNIISINTNLTTIGNKAYMHFLKEFNYSFTCKGVSCVMDCRLKRLSQELRGVDNYTTGVFIHAIDFHIQKDTDGSISEYAK